MEFYRNKKKSAQLIFICSVILFALVAVFLYSIGLFTGIIATKLAGISAVLGLILLIMIIRMLISLNRSIPMLVLNKEGISSSVTAVSKAAGLIYWEDILHISLTKVGWDTLVELTVSKSEHYMPIIKKKLSAMAVSGIQDSAGNLQIFLTASELDMNADELFKIIQDYRKKITGYDQAEVGYPR
ncbi:STM3941 family protein [Pedobacter sp. R20-19]|uniref:STM3941 family protein n=1 Tax=Pedobacter sp. R20-19 TaxID=1270196 RepID=UPI00049337EE|nr:STM3941 family protein [Pedobacter sp. R20-19]